jgi:hypothetical protein
MNTDQPKTATCRWCQSKFQFTATEKPELPGMCFSCAKAALIKHDSQPPRRRVKIPFTRL